MLEVWIIKHYLRKFNKVLDIKRGEDAVMVGHFNPRDVIDKVIENNDNGY